LPPGIAVMFDDAWRALDQSVLSPAPTGHARGQVEVQLSAPAISVVSGSASQATVNVWVRARFYPDTAAANLPSPIHGRVEALYVASPQVLPDGRRVLRVQVTPDDSQIHFVPEAGTGLTNADAQVLFEPRAHGVETLVRAG
jgi:hypothetical protein